MTFRDWNSSGGSPFGGFPFGGFPFGGGESSERRAPQTLKLNFSRKTIVLLALLFFLTAGLPALANFLADYYWFSAEGIASVFWKRLMPQWILAAAVAILTFAVLYPNVRLALRLARDVRIPAAEGLSALLRHPLAVWAPLAVSVVVAVSDGAGAMDKWQMIFQFLYGGEFGSKDAIFGNDIGFYMFSLPFWNFLQSWLVGVLTASLFLCGGLYGLTVMAASHETGRISIPVKIRAHALLLAAGIVFCWG
ncbi:MAG: UPF0182 family protein, partial [Pyramidobacter sp.]|nr:UPF0182 family protein [Pyramidobacter sp.]